MASVLITGANRGIGLELARQYAQDRWRVHACCRRPDEANELVAALKGLDAVIHPLEVTNQTAIHDLREALDGETIDVLINNAGIIGGNRQAFGDIDYAVWEQTIRTNVFAPYRVTEALADLVAGSERRIVANISSLMGSIADNRSGGRYVYRSSKTALNMVSVNLAQDLAERGIAVLAFHPGWVKTDMGGAKAPLTPQESAAGIRKVIDGAGIEDSGSFINHDGRRLAW